MAIPKARWNFARARTKKGVRNSETVPASRDDWLSKCAIEMVHSELLVGLL